jgi:hypothetical protein
MPPQFTPATVPCFQQLPTSFSRDSSCFTFIRKQPGVGVQKAKLRRKLHPISSQRSTFQRSDTLTSSESHPCAMLRRNSHGIISLHKNRGGGGRRRIPRAPKTQDCFSVARHSPLVTRHCCFPSNLSVAAPCRLRENRAPSWAIRKKNRCLAVAHET